MLVITCACFAHDRYNQIVTAKCIPLVPSLPRTKGTDPAHYPAVRVDSSLGRVQQQGGSSSTPSQEGGSSVDSRPTASPRSSYQTVHKLPPSPSDMLAAWWGLEVADAERFLSKVWKQYPWQQWQARLSALQDFLDVVGGGCPAQQQEEPSTSVSRRAASGRSSTAQAHLRRRSAGSSPLSPAAVAASVQQANAAGLQQQQQQEPAARRRRRLAQQRQVSEVATHTPQHPPQGSLLPAAEQALQHAMQGGNADAVACVSVACHMAPFSQQLWQLPPRPAESVVQFALEHPALVSKKVLVVSCNALTALAAASEYVRQDLRELSQTDLARCLNATPMSIKFVQYLVQTGQPTPWLYQPSELLMQHRLSNRAQPTEGKRATFVEAYPGYEAWERTVHHV